MCCCKLYVYAQHRCAVQQYCCTYCSYAISNTRLLLIQEQLVLQRVTLLTLILLLLQQVYCVSTLVSIL
jgi:hypothetical protein